MSTKKRQVDISFIDPATIVEHEPQLGSRGRWALSALVLFGLVFAVYGIALRGNFIFNDDLVIAQNAVLRSWHGLLPIWLHPSVSPHYRPLAYSILLVQYRVFSAQSPSGYLLVNLVLHAANVLLLWTLLRKLEVPGALAAAAIFAVHPANVEAVAWISQQPMLLCGIFYLSAMLIYLRYCGVNPAPTEISALRLPSTPWKLYGLSLLLCAAALCSHVAAVSLPLVLFGILWWERGKVTAQDLKRLLPMLVMGAAWLALLIFVDHRRSNAVNLPTRLLASCRAVWINLLHLLLPLRLSFAYPKWPLATWQMVFILPMAAAIGLAWRLRTRMGRGFFAAICLFIVTLLPLFLVRSDVDAYTFVSDSHTYFPGIFVIVPLVSLAAMYLPLHRRWIGMGVAGLAVAGLSALALLHLPDYQTAWNLWSATLRCDPNSVVAHDNLGLIEFRENHDVNAARMQFFRALQTNGNDVPTLMDLAMTYDSEHDLDKALGYYFRALNIEPNNPDVHFGLAHLYVERNNRAAAIDEFQNILQHQPGNVEALNFLGTLYFQMNDMDRAIATYHRAIDANPGYTQSYVNLSVALFNKGVATQDQAYYQQAEAILEQVLKIDPTNADAFLRAGQMVQELLNISTDPQQSKNLLDQAEKFYRTALILQPRSYEARAGLGHVLMLEGKYQFALEYLNQAAEMHPSLQEVPNLMQLQRNVAEDIRQAEARKSQESEN